MKDNKDEVLWKTWHEKGRGLLVDLLYDMSQALGYNFDKVQLKRGHYYPTGLGQIENEQSIVRKGFVDIFSRKTLFPVVIYPGRIPEQADGTGKDQVVDSSE